MDNFIFWQLVLAIIHLHTIFEVSNFNRSGHRRRVQNFKMGSLDPGDGPFVG